MCLMSSGICMILGGVCAVTLSGKEDVCQRQHLSVSLFTYIKPEERLLRGQHMLNHFDLSIVLVWVEGVRRGEIGKDDITTPSYGRTFHTGHEACVSLSSGN